MMGLTRRDPRRVRTLPLLMGALFLACTPRTELSTAPTTSSAHALGSTSGSSLNPVPPPTPKTALASTQGPPASAPIPAPTTSGKSTAPRFDRFIGASCARAVDGATWCRDSYAFARVPGPHSFIAAANDYPMMVFLSNTGQVFYLGNFEPESTQGQAIHYLEPELIVSSGVQDILPWAGGHLRHMADGRVLFVGQEEKEDEFGFPKTWTSLAPETFIEGRYSRVFMSETAYCALGSDAVRCSRKQVAATRVLSGHLAADVRDLAVGSSDHECVVWAKGDLQCWKLERALKGTFPDDRPSEVRFPASLVKLAFRNSYLLGLTDKGELWHWDANYGRMPSNPRHLTHAGKVRDLLRERGDCIISEAGELLCYVHDGKQSIPLIDGTPEPPEFLTEPFRYGNNPPWSTRPQTEPSATSSATTR